MFLLISILYLGKKKCPAPVTAVEPGPGLSQGSCVPINCRIGTDKFFVLSFKRNLSTSTVSEEVHALMATFMVPWVFLPNIFKNHRAMRSNIPEGISCNMCKRPEEAARRR